jgi:hypothetical protein
MPLFFVFAVAVAPPPPSPPGTPPTTIADLVRIKGPCSLSVVTVGDDGLSSRFNDAVIQAAKSKERSFCLRGKGNYLIDTNTNVRPTNGEHFRYDVTIHDARDFVANYYAQSFRTLGADKRECKTAIRICADQAVDRLLQTLRAR